MTLNHYKKYINQYFLCVISGFRREVAENCALLGYYAASSGRNYHCSLRNNPEERSSHYFLN